MLLPFMFGHLRRERAARRAERAARRIEHALAGAQERLEKSPSEENRQEAERLKDLQIDAARRRKFTRKDADAQLYWEAEYLNIPIPPEYEQERFGLSMIHEFNRLGRREMMRAVTNARRAEFKAWIEITAPLLSLLISILSLATSLFVLLRKH